MRKKFTEFKDESSIKINELIKKYDESIDEINSTVKNIKTSNQSCNTTAAEIEKILQNAATIHKEIIDTRDAICADNERSILHDVKDSQNTITEIYNSIVPMKEYMFGGENVSRIPIPANKYNTLPEDKREMRDGKHFEISTKKIIGIKQELDELLSTYTDIEQQELNKISDRDKTITNKTNELYDKITNLLPGATAAGLTTAYETAKIEARSQIILWSIFFGISLVGIVIESSVLISKDVIHFGQEINFQNSIIQVLRLIGLEFPFVWLAWAANIKISQYSRLYEEYRHKWTMTRTFEGMREAIESSDNSNEENNTGFFYKAILNSFADNPSKTLDKDYKPDGLLATMASLTGVFKKRDEVRSNDPKGEKK